ncbi:sensor histidine kinase [Peribacillus acanthi]|uniref:sensor histidine kinase n=1 Tax=Peribacillus acanthi TaxID=2171554 RepID=UPI000D3E189B|nr:HAMP domain-containing sensor histidine kinase [Peribacillus acanthi]
MKISLKLGLWFFICILLIESTSMIFLHSNVIHSRINEELQELKSRGNSHRDVLEISSDSETLKHIKLMESYSDTDVVVTNNNGDVIISSQSLSPDMQAILELSIDEVPRNGLILQKDLSKDHISTVTAFDSVTADKQGYVYMFKKTETIERFIGQLNKHFILASLLIFILLLVTIFFLSNVLTKPIILMKKATNKLSLGDFSVTLPTQNKDDLGELAQSIQKLASDLNYMKKERNEFLASISHELRTPLTYIKGYSDIARRIGIDEKDKAQYLTIIHEESERVSQLLEELFSLASVDQNTFPIIKEKVMINSSLNSIYDKVLPAFNNKHITLELECMEELVLYLDPNRFEQLLLNLLDNALKYSPEGSKTVIKALKKENEVHIIIKDEGIGIPETDLPFIFDRLYRVEKSRARTTGGFGLGLSIVKELVEINDGSISVVSKVGIGTCFKLIFKEPL